MIKTLFYKILDFINKNGDYIFSIKKIKKTTLRSNSKSDKLNLNIGSGGYNISGFIDLDYDSTHYNVERSQKFIKYDIRNDKIPFKTGEVDNIFCSHVIEHIEDSHVQILFKEASRVLKPGGVLRIATPDSKFLHQMLLHGNSFWDNDRTKNWFISRGIDLNECDEIDFFIREISTKKLKFFSKENLIYYEEVKNNINDYEKIIKILSQDDNYDRLNIGNHINNWDFEKVKRFTEKYFSDIIESRYNASLSSEMQGSAFDLSVPEISLYIDLRK